MGLLALAPDGAKAQSNITGFPGAVVTVWNPVATTNSTRTDSFDGNYDGTNYLGYVDRGWTYNAVPIVGAINSAVSGNGLALQTNLNSATITVTNTAGVSGNNAGGILSLTTNNGAVSYSGAGSISNSGSGAGLAISTSGGTVNTATIGGSVTSTSGGGINIQTGGGTVTNLTTSSTVSGGGAAGILISSGGGNITLTTNGTVSGDQPGVDLNGAGGNVNYTANASVTGAGTNGQGISAVTTGTGTVTVTVNNGGTTIDGQNGNGILTQTVDGLNTVTINNGTIKGTVDGVHATATGTGSVVVNQNGGSIGTSGQRIGGQAIYANAQNGGNVTINTGTGTSIYSTGIGIQQVNTQNSVAGSGSLNISTGTSSTIDATAGGIAAYTQFISPLSTITITTGASSTITTSGGTGIYASTYNPGVDGNVLNQGQITVTTGASSTINAANYGILASSGNSNIHITSNGNINGTGGAGSATGNDGIRAVSYGNASIDTRTASGTAINAGQFGIYNYSSGSGAVSVTADGAVKGGAGFSGIHAEIDDAANFAPLTVRTGGGLIQGGLNGIFAGSNGVGSVTVDAGTGGVTGAANGIYAVMTNTGNASNLQVSFEGAVTGNGTTPFSYTSPVDGSVYPTQTGAAVLAYTAGTGGVTVTADTGSSATGLNYGIRAYTDNTVSPGAILVNSWGAIKATDAASTAIDAETAGYGSVTVNTGPGGTVEGGLNGIVAWSHNLNNNNAVTVTATDTITTHSAGGAAIYARQDGTGGPVTVTTSAAAPITAAGAGDGIDALITNSNNLQNVVVTNNATIDSNGGANGILAKNQGLGAVTVTVNAAIGATQAPLTGVNAIINNSLDTKDVTVHANAAITGGNIGVSATTDGTGNVVVDGAALVTGTNQYGITATQTNNTAGTIGNVTVSGAGNTASTGGVGINAQITGANNSGAVLVNRTGTVSVGAAGGNGINATTAGVGTVTATGVGNVQAGTGAGAIGINAQNTNTGADGAVLVTPAGTVSGGNGINASSAGTVAGSTVTVTTANGAAGNVSGVAGYGIQTSAVTGNTVITNNAASVSGTTWAATATSNGTGIITITDGAGAAGTGAGLYAGGTSGGINANLLAANAATTDGIIISGTGNTTSTTGVGINATIVAGNNTNINITRSGTTTVTTAGSTSDGINAVTAGLGSVTVTGVGNVTGGTGAGAVGINAQNTNAGASKGVLVTPAGTVSGTSGINATNAGTNTTSTVTVNSGFNVTASGGNGITTTTVTGKNTVNMTAGTIAATANGIDSSSSGTGQVEVNASGGSIGVSGTPVGGIGINATSSGTGAGAGLNTVFVNNTATPIFSTGDGIHAALTNAANTGNVTINDGTIVSGVGQNNAAIVSSSGHGIFADIATGGTGNIAINANSNITATSTGKDGIIANNHGAGSSTIVVASGADASHQIVISGDPGIVNDTAGGNATVTVNNFDTVQGGVGIINRQNSAAGTGQALVTVGTNSTVTGDGTSPDPLNGYGIYNRNFSTAVHVGTETQGSANSAWVVTGNGDTINATAAGVAGTGVSGIYNQAAGATAEVNFNSATGVGTTSTINVNATGFGSSYGIQNTTASTTSGDVSKVTTGDSSSIKITTGNSNGNFGILSSDTGASGSVPVTVTTGTSSVINVTADGSSTVNAAAGNNNTGISALASGGAGNSSPVTVTTGTSSAINIGNGNTGLGVNATTSGTGLVTVTTGTSSTITVGAGDSGRGVLAATSGTGAVGVTTKNGTSITVTDNTTGAGTISNAVRADSTSGNITINIGQVAADTTTLNVAGTAGGAAVRAETTNGGSISITTQSGATLDSAGSEGRGILARLSNVGTGTISVTNNGIIGTNAATRVGLTGIFATQNDAVGQTGNITVTNTSTGKIYAGTDGIVAGGTSILATTATTGDVSVTNAGTVNANQRGVFMGSPGLGTAADPVMVSLNNSGTIIGGLTADGTTTGYAAIDVSNGNTAVPTVATSIGATAVQTLITNSGTVNGSGLGSLTACPLTGPAGVGCNPTVYVHTASGAILNNTGTIIDNNNNATSRGTLALYFTSGSSTTNTINNNSGGTITGRVQLSLGTDLFNNNAGSVWNVTNGGGAGQAGANFGDITNLNKLTNAGTINTYGTTDFLNLPRFDNSGTFNAGDSSTSVTSISTDSSVVGPATATGISQIVNNTGTMNVQGQLRFISDATFNNAGGLIDMRTGVTHVTTDIVTLNTNVGTGATANTYTTGTAYDFTGGANSRLGVDAYLGSRTNSVPWTFNTSGSDVPADRLIISGNADTLATQSALATGVLVNDTNGPNGAAYNPTGITIVGVNGTSANAFRITSITCNGVDITTYCASTGDLLQASRGPMGAIKKGFWFYPLLQTTHAEAVADGLTGANSTEYRLYGLPDIETYQLAKLTTGMQNIYMTTAGDWLDRQNDLHHWIRRGEERSNNANGSGADNAPGYLSSTGPGVWLKATGNWTNRKSTASDGDLVAAAGVLPSFDIGYKQNTYSLQGGLDFGRENLFHPTDAVVVGLLGGYIDSTMKFNDGTNSLHYTGGTAGVSATYLRGGFFADGLFKADLLRVGLNFGSLSQFGFGGPTISATNLGGLGNLGYRFEHNNVYFEPALTGVYVKTTVSSFSGLGTGVTFPSGESLRGAAGARLGTEIAKSPTETLDLSIAGRFWDEFTSKGGAIFTTTGPTLTLTDPHSKTYVEVQGLADLKNSATGWSGFLMGGFTFNKDSKTITGKAGSRYQW